MTKEELCLVLIRYACNYHLAHAMRRMAIEAKNHDILARPSGVGPNMPLEFKRECVHCSSNATFRLQAKVNAVWYKKSKN